MAMRWAAVHNSASSGANVGAGAVGPAVVGTDEPAVLTTLEAAVESAVELTVGLAVSPAVSSSEPLQAARPVNATTATAATTIRMEMGQEELMKA